MIRIRVERNDDGQPTRILITGHANSGPRGHDLVCAAVSGVTFMVNAMEQMTGVQMHQPNDGEGRVECSIPSEVTDHGIREKLTLLMEAMVLTLQNIADQFPEYIRLTNQR